MRVLIAEDDAVLRRLLQNYLEKNGHEIVAARNGAEAWERFREGEFHFVITDWMMPECTGVELIRRIRASDRPGYVYVILLTSRSEKEDLLEGMDAGADDFVAKPFDQDELRVRIRAGERILTLEQKLLHSERLASAGEAATQQASGIDQPLADLTRDLHDLRKDALAALALLEKYRESRYTLMRSSPDLAIEAARTEEEIDYPSVQKNLPRQFDRALDDLQRVHEVVKDLRNMHGR
jgi:two-component system, NtrC family, sensor kinase